MRINIYLRNCGLASRRKVEDLIIKKKIKVNGKIATPLTQVNEDSKVEFKGSVLSSKKKIYIVLNKPKGCLSTREERSKELKTVLDLIPDLKKTYIFPVGRLDFNTTGLLLLTNDGLLTNLLLHPKYMIERIYEVKLSRKLSVGELEILNSQKGVKLWGKNSKQKVRTIGDRVYEVKLWSGSKNHIKRLFQLFKINVWKLNRVSFAGIKIGKLKRGEARYLNNKEIKHLFNLTNSKIKPC